jgi:hypothetical protein
MVDSSEHFLIVSMEGNTQEEGSLFNRRKKPGMIFSDDLYS